jgi:hypothetical protein
VVFRATSHIARFAEPETCADMMNTRDLAPSLTGMFSELVDGPPKTGAYILNQGDAGLLRSLDQISATAASAASHGSAPIAAHVDHLRYGLWMMNRWALGENPWKDADWQASWRITSVTDDEWSALRAGLRAEAQRWVEVLRQPRDVNEVEMNALLSSIAHLAYHVGAIRQINRATRGPSANDGAQ